MPSTIPQEIAATDPFSGLAASLPSAIRRRQARSSATKAPVIDAQRVPPSAVSTSQSSQTVRSPSAWKSMTPRSERPMSRWISTVRPSGRPLDTSRALRSPVDAGSIPYSAVTQPVPRPAIQRGTDSSTDAVQITRVSPWVMSAEPVADGTKPGSMRVGRTPSGSRPYERELMARMFPDPAGRSGAAGDGRRQTRRPPRRGYLPLPSPSMAFWSLSVTFLPIPSP